MHPKYHGTLDQKIQHNYSNQNYLIETEMISFYGSMQYDKLDDFGRQIDGNNDIESYFTMLNIKSEIMLFHFYPI